MGKQKKEINSMPKAESYDKSLIRLSEVLPSTKLEIIKDFMSLYINKGRCKTRAEVLILLHEDLADIGIELNDVEEVLTTEFSEGYTYKDYFDNIETIVPTKDAIQKLVYEHLSDSKKQGVRLYKRLQFEIGLSEEDAKKLENYFSKSMSEIADKQVTMVLGIDKVSNNEKALRLREKFLIALLEGRLNSGYIQKILDEETPELPLF